VKSALESGMSARSVALEETELEHIEDIQLLTFKPVLYVCNVDEAAVINGNKHVEAVKEAVKNENAELLIISAAIESEIASLDSLEDQLEFLGSLGLKESGVSKLIKAAYRLLKLQTYFTCGVQEVRAWTITKGTKAPQAAAVIHTDFEKGFIRAEVMKYIDYTTLGSELAVKEAGKFGVEGKEYVVEDGDIMHFRFNV
jgi:GTP-binding protein YchF